MTDRGKMIPVPAGRLLSEPMRQRPTRRSGLPTPRAAPAESNDLVAQLALVKVDIAGIGGAMPSMARELRRSALERLDDVMDAMRRADG